MCPKMPVIAIVFCAASAAASIATLIIAKSGVDKLKSELQSASDVMQDLTQQYEKTRTAIRQSLI